jgi:hypothetical protein
MSQLQTVLDALTRYRTETPLGHQPHMITDLADEAIAIVKQMMQAEPVACLVETERSVLVWPIDDFNDASTYCEPDDFPQYLYTHPEPQTVPAGFALVPVELTPEMLRAIQLKSAIGAEIAANWTGAYESFQELYSVAITAAPKGAV